jgi:hypothetical protein
MIPNCKNCQTPRGAKAWFRDWLKKNDIAMDCFGTPRGIILIDKDKEVYRLRFNGKWVDYDSRELFILNVAETLAICFKD